MDKLYNILLYSNNISTCQLVNNLPADSFRVHTTSQLPDSQQKANTQFQLAIIETQRELEIDRFLNCFSATPVIFIVNEISARAFEKINAPFIDFLIQPQNIHEVEIRIKRLLLQFNQRLLNIKKSTHKTDVDSLLSESDDALYVVEVEKDGNYKFLGVNEKLERITGIEKNLYNNKRLSNLISTMSLRGVELCRSNFDKCFLSESPAKVVEFSRNNGKLIEWETLLIPVKNQHKKVTHIIGYSFNNSVARVFNHIISERETYFHAIFESSRDAILVLNKEGKFIDCNVFSFLIIIPLLVLFSTYRRLLKFP